MYQQATVTETVSLPPIAVTVQSASQLNKILQAFIQRKWLCQYHPALKGVVVNVQVRCFDRTTPCDHERHLWTIPRESQFVRLLCTFQARYLALQRGDRLPSTVKRIEPTGLLFQSAEQELELLVREQSANEPGAARTIPEHLWRIGAFATVLFEGVSLTEGVLGSISPESRQPVPSDDVSDALVGDARDYLQELDSMMASGSDQLSAPKKLRRARRPAKNP